MKTGDMVEIKNPCGEWNDLEKVGVVLAARQCTQSGEPHLIITVLHLSGDRENWYAGGWRVVSENR